MMSFLPSSESGEMERRETGIIFETVLSSVWYGMDRYVYGGIGGDEICD